MKSTRNEQYTNIQLHTQTIEYFLQNPVINWNDGIMLVKDINHKFISSNHNFSKFSGVTPYHLVGMCDEDMPWYESSNIYVKHEDDILSGDYYNVIEPLDGVRKTNLFTSKKIIYDNNGKPAGTIATAIFCNKIIEFDNVIRKSTNLRTSGYRGYNLTASETIILYYILKGYSRNRISEKTGMTKHSYDFHLKNLKVKFRVNDKDDIIDVCIKNGFHDIYPFHYQDKRY